MTESPRSLRDRWNEGETTLGLWASIGSPGTAELLGRAGADYVCLDNQHGLIGYEASAAMVPSVLLGGTPCIARVPWFEPGIIGKLLDAGCEGIIVPMVNTADDARASVQACHYPPFGKRSWGPIAALPRHPDYFDTARDRIASIVMVETAEALANVDEIVRVDGVDAVYVGPADLSISLGLPPGNHDDNPVFVEALQAIVAACRNAGVVPGIHSNGALTPRRLEMGFRMVTVSSDAVGMRLGLASEFDKARSSSAGAVDGSMY